MTRSFERLAMVAIAGAAFVLGAFLPRSYLDAQGRGPSIPPPPTKSEPIPSPGREPVVYAEENGHACAGNGFLAVTGSYGVGTSVLYLVDTVSRQLSGY